MPDYSVYQRQKTLADYMGANEDRELQRQVLMAKARQDATGSVPAAIQIAKEIEKRLAAGDVAGANLLHQTAKTYAIDRGMNAYGGGLAGALTALPQDNNLAVTPFVEGQQIPTSQEPSIDPIAASRNAILKQQQFTGVSQAQRPDLSYAPQAIPGYAQAAGGIAATKKGMETDAANASDRNWKPGTENLIAQGKEIGKDQGEKTVDFNQRISRMPQLQGVTQRLSALGKAATYTMAGRGRDVIARELGRDVPDAAVARTEYISMVDNEVLPLLRETFGAQFTQKEGDSLKVTLGDPNKSPMEKDAVLRSFIGTKMETLNTLARNIGEQEPYSQEDIVSFKKSIGGGSLFERGKADFESKKPKKRLKYNSATGELE